MDDKELIGRIKSELLTFTNGFIYFNNTVVKIRYDLINANDSLLTANQIFDIYEDVFDLNSGQRI